MARLTWAFHWVLVAPNCSADPHPKRLRVVDGRNPLPVDFDLPSEVFQVVEAARSFHACLPCPFHCARDHRPQSFDWVAVGYCVEVTRNLNADFLLEVVHQMTAARSLNADRLLVA